MNIAFDAAAILGPMSKNRGIGNYALNQFKAMINNDKKNNYFFLNFYEDFKLSDHIKSVSNFEEFYFYCGKDNFLLVGNDYQEIIGDIIKKFIIEHDIHVYYITSPFEFNNVEYKKSWFEHVKVVATVYDIIPYVFKDRYLGDHNTYKWYVKHIDMLKWIDKLLVISNSVKDDMSKYMGFNKDNIEVIYGSIDDVFKKVSITEMEKINLLSKYKIDNKFIMCTGGDDDRKNIKNLIVSYSKMPVELINNYQLVIVCKLSSEALENYRNVVTDNNVTGRVVFTNFVTTEELVYLYNLAYLMAFPSQYEGFGLPILEAWACQTPVLTSNNSSLGEIAGEAAILVDPFNNQDIIRGLTIALSGERNLRELVEKGNERLKIFQWSKVSEAAINAINSIEELPSVTIENSRNKIAFFTPLPPLQSGISDYSVDIISELNKYFSIDVYIDSGYVPDCGLDKNIKIINHKEFIKNADDYFDIIYQMGNSEYHEYMHKYIVKYTGTLVLHDYNLHSLIQYLTLYKQSNNIKKYKEYLLEDYNKEYVDNYLDKLRRGESPILIDKMELNGYVTNYAKKIIVHSNEAREKLLIRNISRNVKTIRSYAKIEDLMNVNDAKIKQDIGKDEIIIASFGHIHENKRILPTLKAFSMLSKEYKNMKYYLVGKMDDSLKDRFYQIVKEDNIENYVKVTGYTDLDKFNDYLDIADICINLRYPYNGETSAALMRMLAKGKSILVNDIGSFSEIPDDCCIKLPPVSTMQESEEVKEIYNKLKELINDDERRKAIEFNARKYAVNYLDINVIGLRYKEYIYENYEASINENHILNITNYEMMNNKYNNEEIRKLAKTLGYSKSVIK